MVWAGSLALEFPHATDRAKEKRNQALRIHPFMFSNTICPHLISVRLTIFWLYDDMLSVEMKFRFEFCYFSHTSTILSYGAGQQHWAIAPSAPRDHEGKQLLHLQLLCFSRPDQYSVNYVSCLTLCFTQALYEVIFFFFKDLILPQFFCVCVCVCVSFCHFLSRSHGIWRFPG